MNTRPDRSPSSGPTDPTRGDWARSSYWANLVDMHVPDEDPDFLSAFDPAEYAARLREARVQSAYLYGTSCLGISYWPTQIGHYHARYAATGRDLFGETVERCRESGMDVIGYHNFWSKWAYDTHPEWRVLRSDGKGSLEFLRRFPGRFGVCCFNSGYGRHFLDLTAELCSSYEFEGFWIDMLSWPGVVCYCRSCEDRYREEAGREIPRIVHWEDPEWVAFQRRREEWLAEYAQKVVALAKALQPGISVGFNHALWLSGWAGGFSSAFFEAADYLSGDFYGGRTEQSLICKLFEGLGGDHVSEFMTSRCADLQEQTITKPIELLEAQALSALSNNKRFLFIDAIHPTGELNPDGFRVLGEVHERVSPYLGCLSADSRHRADVGVYMNFESQADLADNGMPAGEVPAVRGVRGGLVQVVDTLTAGHVLFDIITPKKLAELDRYAMIMLPDLLFMDEAEVEAFTSYVEGGGNLYASKNTSLRTKAGHRVADFLLADVFGAHFDGTFEFEPTFVAPLARGEALLPGFSSRFPLTVRDSQIRVRADGRAKVLSTVALPYAAPGEVGRFSTANCDPPARTTQSPSIVVNEYGRGISVYSSAAVEAEGTHAHRHLVLGIIAQLTGKPLVWTDAPGCVEVNLFEQHEALVLTLLNFQRELPNIPVRDVSVAVRLDGAQPLRLTRWPDHNDVVFEVDDDFLTLIVDRLDTFAAYRLEFQRA